MHGTVEQLRKKKKAVMQLKLLMPLLVASRRGLLSSLLRLMDSPR